MPRGLTYSAQNWLMLNTNSCTVFLTVPHNVEVGFKAHPPSPVCGATLICGPELFIAGRTLLLCVQSTACVGVHTTPWNTYFHIYCKGNIAGYHLFAFTRIYSTNIHSISKQTEHCWFMIAFLNVAWWRLRSQTI